MRTTPNPNRYAGPRPPVAPPIVGPSQPAGDSRCRRDCGGHERAGPSGEDRPAPARTVTPRRTGALPDSRLPSGHSRCPHPGTSRPESHRSARQRGACSGDRSIHHLGDRPVSALGEPAPGHRERQLCGHVQDRFRDADRDRGRLVTTIHLMRVVEGIQPGGCSCPGWRCHVRLGRDGRWYLLCREDRCSRGGWFRRWFPR